MSTQINPACRSLQLFSDWLSPDEVVRRQCKGCYDKYPLASRAIALPIAALSGFLKPILFPVVTLVGAIVIPLIALGRALCQKEDAGDWLLAWTFSVIGASLFPAFCIISAYYLPIIASSGIFIACTAISISFHVYRSSEQPN